MNMIERVARALCDDTLSRWRSPIALQNEPWKEFIPAARAAIEAMREPTEGMVDAACEVKVLGADLHDFTVFSCAEPVWQAMIDAALAE